jgi:PAS domain S-box-containing protein
MMKHGQDEESGRELELLRARVEELEEALAAEEKSKANLVMQRERSEEALRQYSFELEERVKELGCLYAISRIIEEQELTLEEILQKAAAVIPPGWRYNDIARARITLNGREYRSSDFETSPWGQSSRIFVHGKEAGSIEVYYLEQRPEYYEGPFLKEERALINALAERLGRVIERKGMVEALRESEERYKLIYDFTGEAIYTYDTDFVLIGVNRKACEFIGYQAEELVGRNVLELGILHPDDLERTMADIQKLFQGEEVTDELRFVKKDGSVAIGEVTGAPLYDKKGEMIAFTNVARDITDAKKAELDLIDSEDKFRSIVEQSYDGIVLVNREGVIVGWNQAQAEIVGVAREEAMGKFLWDMQFSLATEERRMPQAHDQLRDLVLEPQATGEADWFGSKQEQEIQRPDGQRRTIESVIFPIQTREGFMMCGISRDITEGKRAAEELMRINRELDAYAHVVSHDLRGPISIVISASNALQEMLPRPILEDNLRQIGKAAEIIRSSADTARLLVEDLLSLAQAGQHPGEVMEVGVRDIVRQVLAERSGPIAEKKVRVILDEDLGQVVADPTHVYQLFSNLVANAVKYNDNPDPSLAIHYERGESGVHHYTVWDNGPGIPPGDEDKVFAPLFKGDGGGTGVGLAIVKKIVDVYDGEIKVYNDGGARFDFTLRDGSTRQDFWTID